MRTITREQLEDTIIKHEKYLTDMADGICADLRDTDLHLVDLNGANLSSANLMGANLSGANLSGANLSGADLSGADLSGADLSCADLNCADLNCADLSCADLVGANLRYAYMSCADLSCADLVGANLRYADLRYADLGDADLSCADLSGADLNNAKTKNVIYNESTAFFAPVCPEKGSFIGYKKANNYIVELEICADAQRSSATTRKCRCDKAKVLSITSINGIVHRNSVRSDFDPNFVYKVGEIVSVQKFDENRWNECSTGIHFFITRDEAVKYLTV